MEDVLKIANKMAAGTGGGGATNSTSENMDSMDRVVMFL